MSDQNAVSMALLVPLEQVAGMLGVCVRTIRREIERGQFPRPVGIGRRKLIVRSELEAYLERKKRARE